MEFCRFNREVFVFGEQPPLRFGSVRTGLLFSSPAVIPVVESLDGSKRVIADAENAAHMNFLKKIVSSGSSSFARSSGKTILDTSMPSDSFLSSHSEMFMVEFNPSDSWEIGRTSMFRASE
jgi:hypothetical protein